MSVVSTARALLYMAYIHLLATVEQTLWTAVLVMVQMLLLLLQTGIANKVAVVGGVGGGTGTASTLVVVAVMVSMAAVAAIVVGGVLDFKFKFKFKILYYLFGEIHPWCHSITAKQHI